LSSDQYVIPGNIIYKQRGTIWFPGENTHMGRDHTIHSSVSGYVKYYRDPLKHPDRQYIGVVFNRDDKLPYPPGTPRKRKLSMVAVPRRPDNIDQETLGPSGIPNYIVRRPQVMEVTAAGEETAPAVDASPDAVANPPTPTEAAEIAGRAAERAARIAAARQHKATRVLRLRDDYSYRETNWEIGRLPGPVGRVGGTEKRGSRRAVFRKRRHQRHVYFDDVKYRTGLKKKRAAEVKKVQAEKRAIREAEREQAEAMERAARQKAEREDAERLKTQD
jgi:ribosomal protein L27